MNYRPNREVKQSLSNLSQTCKNANVKRTNISRKLNLVRFLERLVEPQEMCSKSEFKYTLVTTATIDVDVCKLRRCVRGQWRVMLLA